MKRFLAAVLMLCAMAAFGQSAQVLPIGASANAAYTGTAGTTSTFARGATRVAVFCTTTCFVKVGESPTATTSDVPLPANVLTILAVPPGTGASWAVSAVQQAAGGSVFAQPTN